MSPNTIILTWNVRGVISSSLCLVDILARTNCDIAIITEHKLKSTSANYLDTISQQYCSITRIENCINNTSTDSFRFMGKGGGGIMYKKNMQFSIVEIPDIDSTRIVGEEL